MLSSLAPFISFYFLSAKHFDKRLSVPKIWHIWVKYCWNYGLSNLLFRFTRHILQQPKNRRKKIAINSLISLIESYYRKKYLVKVWSFFDPPTGKWWPFKTFAKLNRKDILSAIFGKFRNDQSYLLTGMHYFD